MFNKKGIIASAILIITGSFLGYEIFFDRGERLTDKIEETTSLLKVGFITDWEYGTRKQIGHKMTRQAPVQLAKAVIYLNEQFRPDIVVGGGDYIESSGTKPEDAKSQLKEINEVFSLIQAPRIYALGNHDLRSLSKDEVREALEIAENHSVKDIGDWRIIVLDTNFNSDGTHRSAKNYVVGGVSQDELKWLEESLKTERPVLVFSHHSPIPMRSGEGVLTKNINDAQSVRIVLEKAGNVVAVISGHNPTSYYEKVNSINYFITDTLVDRKALGSFATIEAIYDRRNKYAKIKLRQLRTDPIEYNFEWQFGKNSIVQSVLDEGMEVIESTE